MKKIDYLEWSKEELVKEIIRIKSTTYGLVWHRDLPEEKIDILVNPDARTPNEMFPNEMAGKPFPILKEVNWFPPLGCVRIGSHPWGACVTFSIQ